VGSDSGSVEGSSWPGAHGALLDGEGVVEGDRVACKAVAERDEALHAEKIDVCFGDGPRVCLVELVDVNRRTWDGAQIGWGGRTTALSSPLFVCLDQLGTHHPHDVRHRRTGRRRYHFGDAIRVVTMPIR
jgi:hypothetical protein